MASGFRFEGGSLQGNLLDLDRRVHGAVSAVVDYNAAVSEVELKTRAPWTDQTGAARTGLNAQSYDERLAWTLILAHAVNYGIWLETRKDFNGRYAVILPVLVDTGNRIMAMLEGLFGKVE